ncbi:acyltransferase [Lachnospiraceae bacterium]|nr:acyltransferase [Lachnospiraceae bacterium]
MRQRKNYAAIDNFRLTAALLIVAIHTSPLKSFSETADFLVTYCFGRIGVPFFLMVTGYFVLAPYQRGIAGIRSIGKFLRKTAILYGISTLLYLPLKIYSGNFSLDAGQWLKEVFFDGTFYHLWYLPAVIMGCLLLIVLLRCCSPLSISAAVFVLYVIGVFGDSYYNLICEVPVLKAVYGGIFQVSSYTRNGIFLAPAFLWMGVVLANGKVRLSKTQAEAGFLISMAFMLAEGFVSFYFKWQKHNSMYFMLIPVMFFLFEFLLSEHGTELNMARDLSMYIYILHPFCIVLVRGLAGALKATKLLVEQSLLHYLAVIAVSAFLSLLLVRGKQALSAKR